MPPLDAWSMQVNAAGMRHWALMAPARRHTNGLSSICNATYMSHMTQTPCAFAAAKCTSSANPGLLPLGIGSNDGLSLSHLGGLDIEQAGLAAAELAADSGFAQRSGDLIRQEALRPDAQQAVVEDRGLVGRGCLLRRGLAGPEAEAAGKQE